MTTSLSRIKPLQGGHLQKVYLWVCLESRKSWENYKETRRVNRVSSSFLHLDVSHSDIIALVNTLACNTKELLFFYQASVTSSVKMGNGSRNCLLRTKLRQCTQNTEHRAGHLEGTAMRIMITLRKTIIYHFLVSPHLILCILFLWEQGDSLAIITEPRVKKEVSLWFAILKPVASKKAEPKHRVKMITCLNLSFQNKTNNMIKTSFRKLPLWHSGLSIRYCLCRSWIPEEMRCGFNP